jgi:TATA-box binding protein (TBP) (component of TFIID and TFIIIB)
MDTIETTCGICKNPTFLCNCESGWNVFDKILSDNCTGKEDINNNVIYSDISISTMTICFNFNQIINLALLKEKLPSNIINYNPGSKKSKIQKKKGTDSFYNSFDIKLSFVDNTKDKIIFSNVSIFIFPNGKAKAAGIKTINTINIMINELIDLICSIPETLISENGHIIPLIAENVKIQMICSDFKIKPIVENPDGWCIKQEELKNILVREHSLSATFSALSRYPGINLKVPSIIEDKKQISLLIFRSGSIIITGAKNSNDISNCYSFINKVISENSKKLFYFDINEELKQKKKKKKIT